MNNVKIVTPFIRLDGFLKLAGAVGTGGEGKVRVLAGQVRVNGETCTQRGRKLVPGDMVEIDGRAYRVAKG